MGHIAQPSKVKFCIIFLHIYVFSISVLYLPFTSAGLDVDSSRLASQQIWP